MVNFLYSLLVRTVPTTQYVLADYGVWELAEMMSAAVQKTKKSGAINCNFRYACRT